jgi:GT2 family glycosyltransferase
MTFVVGIPHCNEPPKIFAATLAAIRASTIKPAFVLVVDNGDVPLEIGEDEWPSSFHEYPLVVSRPEQNIGCAGAWNQICSLTRETGRSVITLNADCTVPPDAFEKMLAVPAPTLLCAFGFGCFRLDAEIYERVGPFDEAYYPVYWEDADYRYRCKLAGVPLIEWPFVEAERTSFGRARYTTGFEHGWRHEDGRGYQGWTDDKLVWFYDCWNKNRERYIAKWGGEVGEEKFTQPFDGKQEG